MNIFELFGTIAIKNQEANEAIKDTTGEAQKAESKISHAFEKIGSAVVTYFAADKLISFGTSCIQAAADVEAAQSQFSQVFSEVSEDAATSLSVIAEKTGVVAERLKGSFTQIAAFAKTTGMNSADSLSLSERAMTAVADSAAFYDRSLEDVTNSLQSFLKGNFENDAALGLSCTETTRNAAANKLFGESFIDLSEAQKQLTLLQMVEDANAASGALGQASRESGTWTNQLGNLQTAWQGLKALLGSKILEPTIAAVEWLSTAIQKCTAFIGQHKTAVTLITVAVGTMTAAIIAYNIAQNAAAIATGIATAATSAFGAVMAFVTSPITLVVAAIGALIAIIVLCVKHWDEITAKVSEVAASVVAKVSELVESLKANISEFILAGIQFIVGLFQGMWDELVSASFYLSEWINAKLIKPFKDKFSEFLSVGKSIITKVWDGVKEVGEKVKTWFSNFGTNIINKLLSGMQNAWGNITSWFNNVWDSLFNKQVNVSADGSTIKASSHRSGLDVVPYDDYPALLHQGEAVLTKAEAEEWRNGGGSGNKGGLTIIQNIQAVASTPVQFASATEAYFEQARWTI